MPFSADAIEDSATALPEGVRDLGQMYLAQIEGLNTRVGLQGVRRPGADLSPRRCPLLLCGVPQAGRAGA